MQGAFVGLGIKGVLDDLGLNVKLRIRLDATAAKGTASRGSLGKTHHLEVNQLWVQRKVVMASWSCRR